MADELYVQIKFTADTAHGPYSDALYIPKDDFNSLSQDDIDAMKQERIDNWIYFIEHTPPPPPPPEKTDEELQAELNEINARAAVIEALLGA
jgi:hypothetical protein